MPEGLTTPITSAQLNKVACPSAGSCVATGIASAGTTQEFLVETLNEGTWTGTLLPLPTNVESGRLVTIEGLACVSASDCLAVGNDTDAGGSPDMFALVLDQGSWSAISPFAPGDSVQGVACDPGGTCIAVGQSSTSGVILTYAAGQWSASSAPTPMNADVFANSINLDAIACDAPGTCFAVGSYWDSQQNIDGLVLTESGGVWTAAEAQQPADAVPAGDYANGLTSVACMATNSCIAFGSYISSGPNGKAFEDFALQLGGQETAEQVPMPTDDPSGYGGQISCSATSCTAVSPYQAGQGLATVTFNDATGSWLSTELPAVQGYGPNAGNGGTTISCSADGSCTVVGYFLIYYVDGAYTGGSISQLPPATPEAPSVLVLPLTGAAVVGVSLGVKGRRRRRGASVI